MTSREFLDQLWQYKPEEQYILVWTHPDKKSCWFTSIPQAADYVASINGNRDVYVGVGLSGKDYGHSRRCVSEEITGISGLAADFDLLSDAHSKRALARTVDQALSIPPPSMPPTIIIATGNGVHCWWLLKEPYIFDNDEDRKDVARLVTRWHTWLQLSASSRGWAYERLADLARVLRIPGTKNVKDPAHAKDVKVLSATERRYNLSDFEEFLDAAGIPDPEAQEKAAKEWAEKFSDKHVTINVEARIPQDLLDQWMKEDQRFRNTWERRRPDLKDQTNSGYDMALACFGVDAGLSEQQIVDLIIHHRAIHGLGQQKRIHYFQRTISKAHRWKEGAQMPDALAAGSPAPPATPAGQGTPEPASAPAAETPSDPAMAHCCADRSPRGWV